MRVVLPALLDAFDCADTDCACRRALRVATPAKPLPTGRFPYREGEKALLRGAAQLASQPRTADRVEPGKSAYGLTDTPIAVVATPAGAELYFATLCPSVRALLADNQEAVDLARVEGGWRMPLQAFQAADKGREVRLTAKKSLPWRQFQALREVLLDVAADSTHLWLARLARLATIVDAVVTEQLLPQGPSMLTARNFLAFRAFLESRVAAAVPAELAAWIAQVRPLLPELGLDEAHMTALNEALHGDWRTQLRTWAVPFEGDLLPAAEAFVTLRIFAIPHDRDQTIQRGYAEFLEGLAIGLRYAAALADAVGAPLTPGQLVAAFALGDSLVAHAGAALPTFERPADSHERAPRMVDLDMTLESIC